MIPSKNILTLIIGFFTLSGLSCSELAYGDDQICPEAIFTQPVKDLNTDVKLKCVPNLHQFKALKFKNISYRLKLYHIPETSQLEQIRYYSAPVDIVLDKIPSEYDLKRLKRFGITPRFKLSTAPMPFEIKRLHYYGFKVEKVTFTADSKQH